MEEIEDETNLLEFFGNKLVDDNCEFRVYAPNAKEVYVFGNFNNFNKYQLKMNKHSSGYFELCVRCKTGDYYKYNILGLDGVWREKSDPFALATEASDMTFSKIISKPKPSKIPLDEQAPINIYEANIAGFKRHVYDDNRNYKFDELKSLVDHASELGHSHIELMPITEHPFLGSWGYQSTGFFATSFRYGDPQQLVNLIEYAHSKKVGIIIDFVLGHFCKDSFSLENFDGTKIYESGYNELWGVFNFNFNSNFVKAYLKSAINYWLDLGIDGIRIDAVSYILYFDGDESRFNPDGKQLLEEICQLVTNKYPGALLFAEDSSTYQWITKPQGIGFDYKWNMGWMNDVLSYFELDPVYRRDNLNNLTFSFTYMNNESYILPISHDEVVHLKKPLALKFPGMYEQKLAQMRQFYMYMFLHPGAKLNFMGYELCETREFDEKRELAWSNLENEINKKMFNFFKVINHLYKCDSVLNGGQFVYEYENYDDNILSFSRSDETYILQGIMNTSGVYYNNYKIPTKISEIGNLIINSEDPLFGGKVILKEDYKAVDGNIYIDVPAHSMLYLRGRIKDGSIL